MIVAGFGFRASATTESLLSALRNAGGSQPDALATATDKAQVPAFRGTAARLDLPAVPVDMGTISLQPTTTRSTASLSARDTGSLAEAAALAAAGPNARLLTRRAISDDRRATCALAIGDAT